MKRDFFALAIGCIGAYFVCSYLKKRMDEQTRIASESGEYTRSVAMGVRG